MNYAFYLLQICKLDPDLTEHLRKVTTAISPEGYVTYFRKERQPDLTSFNVPFEDIPADFEPVFQKMDKWFPRDVLRGFTVNIIAPNGQVHEHSDASGSPKFVGNAITSFHVVHVSLGGNASYHFRRDRGYPKTTERMEVGGCYLYNNYAFHSTTNGDEPRVNIMLQYGDSDWKIRHKLYTEFKVRWDDY